MKTRVLVISGIRLYREGLVEALTRTGKLVVAGTAMAAADVLGRLSGLRPDVVLLDSSAGGTAEARAILAEAPRTKLIALAVSEAEEEVIAWAEVGVAGFITREASLQDVVETIEGVMRGESIASPRLIATLLQHVQLAGEERTTSVETRLTSREREIVALIDAGLSNKQIAGRLTIEVATVKNHVHNILEKLHVHRRTDAAAWVRERVH
jgi:two-component system, NarL family, nitrate/nitrite response regulator NarL